MFYICFFISPNVMHLFLFYFSFVVLKNSRGGMCATLGKTSPFERVDWCHLSSP
jgi:hypothetical protein